MKKTIKTFNETAMPIIWFLMVSFFLLVASNRCDEDNERRGRREKAASRKCDVLCGSELVSKWQNDECFCFKPKYVNRFPLEGKLFDGAK